MEKKEQKKEIRILGLDIYTILAYFILYSIVGFFLETVFGFITKGVIESRKGFLYGPFCSIYGLGAVVMIIALQYFKKNNYTLFIGGFLVGSVIEYLISLLGELIFKVNWWDYSDIFLNINGRICVMFSLFWGLLAIYLIRHFNPLVDKLLDKTIKRIKIRKFKIITLIFTIFLLFDFIITGIALKVFFARTVYTYNLDVTNKEKYIQTYSILLGHDELLNVTNKMFSNKKMLKTFPNLKLKQNNGQIIYMDSIYSDIQPYYIKFF